MAEGFRKFCPRDALGVLMGGTIALPPLCCWAFELVRGIENLLPVVTPDNDKLFLG